MYGRVERVERLGPRMIRVVLGGEGLAEFSAPRWTDAYINALFVPPGAPYSVPFDVDEARAGPPGQRPVGRRYTVRDWNVEQHQLTIDIVVHGDVGGGGPWALATSPGDLLQFLGPSGAYAPDPDADWHLLVGDESALPAIAASLVRVPPGRPAVSILLVDGPGDEQTLDCPGDLRVTWLHRNAAPDANDLLLRAVEDIEFPPGRVHVFLHGEAGETRAVRRHLLADRGLPRDEMSASPYWRRAYTDERWREVKADWQREVDQEI